MEFMDQCENIGNRERGREGERERGREGKREGEGKGRVVN